MTDAALIPSLRVAITGTDTGVGKSYVTACLLRGLRARGRTVWVHKPIACGGWENDSAEDARFLQPLRDQHQPPSCVCPIQLRAAASPHIAAAQENRTITMARLIAGVETCMPTRDHQHDVIVEGVGGLLVPVTTKRETVADLFSLINMPVIIVTRPHLGTLNHTALTAAVARQHGLNVIGLVLNYHDAVAPSLAVSTAVSELPLVTGLPILATCAYRPHTADSDDAERLAAAVLAATVSASA